MRYFILIFALLACIGTVPAQPLMVPSQPAFKPNTYAVVIGISAYADPDIEQLEFSNRDATVFADFLMSASGGSVPRQNIKLLVDSAATSGEVDKAIRWLKENSKKDDNVFFYFSGHGALENVTMYKNGYLICYNTPSAAFVNMALSIDYLNDVANTLAVEIRANVVMITDACHSGKMAGSKFKGNYLVGEQLLAAKEKEIRMASCTPDQLSNEKKDWGGGRGVFSYHLVNGLQGGLADKNEDKSISLGELKNYMESAMANDPVLKSDGEVQTPVIKAEKMDFVMSTVVKAEAIKVQQLVRDDSVANVILLTAPPLPGDINLEPEDQFFRLLKKENLEALTRDLKLDSIAAETIALTLINKLQTGQISESQKIKLEELKQQLSDKENLENFNISISRAITDKGQDVILRYLKGDEAELEKRRYYNANSSGYDIYTRMFATALKLSQGDKYLSNTTAVLLHYFTGVTLRLKIPLTANPKQLIEQAFREQQKALALEEYAAYIYNELAILNQYKKEYKEAEKLFIKATQLSPRWAIPFSNLCGLYAVTGKLDKANIACQTADSLQAGLQSVLINQAFINEKLGNNLFAEELYRNAINVNSRHFLPFERLAITYVKTTDYAQADSFFYEADLRKKGFHFQGNGWDVLPITAIMAPFAPLFCEVDTSILLPTDIFAFLTWGVQEYGKRNYANAVRILKRVIANDRTNPLVFHYMGKIFYDQQKWEEAEVMFRLALKYSLDTGAFKSYVDSVKRSFVYPYDHSCFENFFEQKYYPQIEEHYFLGTLYEQWKHLEEAEVFFKEAIILDTFSIGGYIKLWRLYERQGRYTEAEATIKAYAVLDKERSERELNEFYRRTIEKFPDDANWNYKLGLLLYSRASANARVPYFDSIAWFPLLNKELLIDMEIYQELAEKREYSLSDLSETGAPRRVTVDMRTLLEFPKSYQVPGTYEFIPLANVIYLPRKDGLIYLKRSAELFSQKEALADINYKIGNIYQWAGSKKQAYPYFERSLEFIPDNANARLNLVDIYTALFKNRAALNQLEYLYDSSQINFEKRLLLAKFNIHAGKFTNAKLLLDMAEAIHPYIRPDIADLRGRMFMLSNKPKEAIPYYQQHFKLNNMNVNAAYSLGRLYAKTGNTSEAFKWVEIAIKRGFNYSYVLKYDPYLDGLRKTERWKTLVNNLSIKQYHANYPLN